MSTLSTLCAGILALAAFSARAQAPAWSWATSLGSAVSATQQALVVDAAGNTYVGGYFTTPLTLGPGAVLTSQGGIDGFVAKYSPTGTLLWASQLAGTGSDRILRLAADASGGVYVLGAFGTATQLGTVPLTAAPGSGGVATLLAKLDAQGQPQWVRQPNTGVGASAADFGVDASGNAYLTGVLSGSATFGAFTLNVPVGNSTGNYFDRFLVKFDPQGTALWARQGGRVQLGTAGRFYFQKLLVGPSGDAYLTIFANAGSSGPFGSVSLPAAGAGDFDAAIVKYDAQGTAQWAQQGGGAGADRIGDAALDGTGRLGFAVEFPGSATFGGVTLTGPGPGTLTGGLVVLDAATGTVQWARALTGTSTARLIALSADAQGTWYVGGSFDGTGALGGRQLTSTGGTDAVVASFSAQGMLGWVQQSAGAGNEAAFYLAIGGGGRLSVGGVFTGTTQLSTFGLTAQGGAAAADIFVAQLATAPLATRPLNTAPLAFYPNPALNTTILALPKLPAGTRLALRDALGRTVRNEPARVALPLTNLAPGLYSLQAIAPNGQQWFAKLTVE